MSICFENINYFGGNAMKVCASCGASLPDGAAFCISCGGKEFKAAYMPDLNAPQQEKPKIEYDQYGRPIGQPYQQQQYEQPHFSQPLDEPLGGDIASSGSGTYDPFGDPYGGMNSGAADYLEGAGQPQYIEQYTPQPTASQYTQQQYAQPQYPQQQYAQPQYEQPQYTQQQYAQQQYEQPQYTQQQYAQQQYEQPQYEQQQHEQQQYAQPQYEQQQPVQQQYEQPQPVQPKAAAAEPQQTAPPVPEVKSEPAPQKLKDPVIDPNAPDPYESSKNFVFEKKEESEETEEEEKGKAKPQNIKEFIAMLQDTTDHTYEFDQSDFAAHKKQCIIASLGITFWWPFAVCSNSYSSRFYASQGFLICILEVFATILEIIFTGIVGVACTVQNLESAGSHLSVVGWILDILFTAIFFVLPVFLIVTSIQNIRAGKIKEIPLIGKYRFFR